MSSHDPISLVIAKLEAGDYDPRKSGEGKYKSRCPSHDGADRNLSVSIGDEGKVLFHCFHGCSTEAIVQAIGLTMADLFPGTSGRPEQRSKKRQSKGPEPKLASESLRHSAYSNLLANATLSERHSGDLLRRGLSPEEITRRGYGSISLCNIQSIADKVATSYPEDDLLSVPGFFRNTSGRFSLACAPSLLIPARNPTGVIIGVRVRPDTPTQDGGKYFWLSSKHHGGPGPGAWPHVPFDSPTSTTWRLTEGELKADIATILSGTPTISASGVSNWKWCLPILKTVGAKTVRLAFDADAWRKKNVAEHLYACSKAIIKAGHTLELERWDDSFKGIDDALAEGKTTTVLVGDDAMEAVLEAARATGVELPLNLSEIRRKAEEIVSAGDLAQLYRDEEFIRTLARLERENPAELLAIKAQFKAIRGFSARDFGRALKPPVPRAPSSTPQDGEDDGNDDGGAFEPEELNENEKPEIILGTVDREEGFKTWTPQALSALKRANDPPNIFQRGKEIVRLRPPTEEDPLSIEGLSVHALRGVFDRVACWGEDVETKKGPVTKYGPPRLDLIRDISSLGTWDESVIPRLESVAEAPRFLKDGTLLLTPGYNAPSRLYYAPSRDLADLDVAERPTADDVDAALALIFDELLYDFPFSNQASKANALAVMLLPFVRLMIDGPTPFHMFEASTEGTGKGKLATVTALPALGRRLRSTPQKEDEAEWRKAITTALMTGQSHVFVDNMYMPRGWDDVLLPVDSGVLASALSESVWEDRILGGNRECSIAINVVWMGSGNNVEFSRELARRVVPIRLDAGQERPWERDGFKHELPQWAEEKRRELVVACLTLCQRWIKAGRKMGKERLGSYEVYSATMGGILATAGVEGFLENKVKGSDFDREAPRWTALVVAWNAKYKSAPTSTGQVWEVITGSTGLVEAFVDVIGESSALSQKQKLGKALARHADRVWGGFRLKRLEAESSSGNALYRLEKAEPPSADHREHALANGTAEPVGDYIPF